jgi:hypothetical protein
MLVARKKANTTSNILSAWKKAGLVPFDPDSVLKTLPKVKKYTAKNQPTLIEPQPELTTLEIRSSSRPMTPADQMTIIHRTMIMQFPVRNATVIQNMIDRISTATPSIPTYQKTIKNYVDYQATLTLIRDLQMKKLRDVTVNKKKRTKQTVGCTVIDPEGWEAIQEGERALQHRKEAKANELARKREATAEKKAAAEAKKVAKAAGKKNNKKGKKADHSAAIDEVEEAIALLFQDTDYGDSNGVEAQLVAELEAVTLNTNEATTTRSSRTRRAPVRFRNS